MNSNGNVSVSGPNEEIIQKTNTISMYDFLVLSSVDRIKIMYVST